MISHLPAILLQASTVTDAVDLEEQVEKTLTATEKLLEAATEAGFVLLKVVATSAGSSSASSTILCGNSSRHRPKNSVLP